MSSALLVMATTAEPQDVNVNVNVDVQVSIDSNGAPLVKEGATVKPTFQSDFFLRTGDSAILVSPLFREPRTPDNLRMELLYSGCFRVKVSELGPPVARGDLIVWARLANSASGTGWGANPEEPARMLGLYSVIRIPHSTLFNYVTRGVSFPAVSCVQVGDVKVLGIVKDVKAVYLNPNFPPTTAEFLVTVEVRVYPVQVSIALPGN
jgi:hypothetical protein